MKWFWFVLFGFVLWVLYKRRNSAVADPGIMYKEVSEGVTDSEVYEFESLASVVAASAARVGDNLRNFVGDLQKVEQVSQQKQIEQVYEGEGTFAGLANFAAAAGWDISVNEQSVTPADVGGQAPVSVASKKPAFITRLLDNAKILKQK